MSFSVSLGPLIDEFIHNIKFASVQNHGPRCHEVTLICVVKLPPTAKGCLDCASDSSKLPDKALVRILAWLSHTAFKKITYWRVFPCITDAL